MREFDFQREGISGVSGATRSSLAILEGVKRRLNEAPAPSTNGFHFGIRDAVLILIVLTGLILPFSSWRGIPLVRFLWSTVLIGYLGLFAGDMLSQALLAGWASHGIPWRNLPGLTVLAAAGLLVPLFSGKQLYCHHLCPHGAAQQWLGKLVRKKATPPPALARWLSRIPAALLAVIFLLLILRVPMNLAAFEPFDAWIFRSAGLASVVLAAVGLAASIVYPLAYCKFGCPTGALLRFLRTGASGDRFTKRDALALALLSAGGVLALFL
jgi:polyferredoxin